MAFGSKQVPTTLKEVEADPINMTSYPFGQLEHRHPVGGYRRENKVEQNNATSKREVTVLPC